MGQSRGRSKIPRSREPKKKPKEEPQPGDRKDFRTALAELRDGGLKGPARALPLMKKPEVEDLDLASQIWPEDYWKRNKPLE